MMMTYTSTGIFDCAEVIFWCEGINIIYQTALGELNDVRYSWRFEDENIVLTILNRGRKLHITFPAEEPTTPMTMRIHNFMYKLLAAYEFKRSYEQAKIIHKDVVMKRGNCPWLR